MLALFPSHGRCIGNPKLYGPIRFVPDHRSLAGSQFSDTLCSTDAPALPATCGACGEEAVDIFLRDPSHPPIARAGQHGMAHARWHHLPDALPAWMPLTSPQATACRHHPSRQTSTASMIRRRSPKRPPDQSEPTGGSRQGHAGSTRRAIHSTRRAG